MIPKVAKSGHSFKGAAAYYLHDKTQDNDFNQASGAKSQTSDRVDWTETRNLATDNPDTAWKVMAASAMDGDYLKQKHREENGQRSQASGQQNGKSVYAYSLGWHPDEKTTLTREDMLAAADDTLKRLGFQDHQAMIIAHNDTAHPHVHVIVNKVHPTTGKTHNPFHDRNRLDKWAREYRKDRGEEHYCPNREKKWQNLEDGVSNKNRQKQTETRLESGETATLSADDPRAAEIRKQQAARANRISEIGKRMRSSHDQQWARFKENNRQAKSDIYDRYDPMMKAARERLTTAKTAHAEIKDHYQSKIDQRMDEIKAKYKPHMSVVGKKLARERYAWERHEQSLGGVVGHAITAAMIKRKLNPAQSKGFVKDTLSMLVNKEDRKAAFTQMQDTQFGEVTKQMRSEMKAARASIVAEQKKATAHTIEAMGAAVQDMKNLSMHRKGELDGLSVSREAAYAELKTSQANDRGRLQAVWGALKARRTLALRALKNRLEQKARTQTANQQSFKAAAKEEAQKEVEKKTRTRNRNRSRSRSRGRTQRYER